MIPGLASSLAVMDNRRYCQGLKGVSSLLVDQGCFGLSKLDWPDRSPAAFRRVHGVDDKREQGLRGQPKPTVVS